MTGAPCVYTQPKLSLTMPLDSQVSIRQPTTSLLAKFYLIFTGNICAGNLSKYIPFIMAEIQENPRRQYLLLHSLKEVISTYATCKHKTRLFQIITCRYSGEGLMHTLQPYVDDIWWALYGISLYLVSYMVVAQSGQCCLSLSVLVN